MLVLMLVLLFIEMGTDTPITVVVPTLTGATDDDVKDDAGVGVSVGDAADRIRACGGC